MKRRTLGWPALVLLAVACDEAAPIVDAGAVAVAVPVDAGEPVPRAVVIAVMGEVEIRRGGEGGVWQRVNIGSQVSDDDSVRTGVVGDLEMRVDDVSVRVRERTTVSKIRVGKSSLRARVHGQMESAIAEGKKGRVELEGEGSDAVVTSENGRFWLTADGSGVVAVGVEAGRASVAVKGKDYGVDQGMVARISETGGVVPKAALRQVLLDVRWPGARETRERMVSVSGRAEPGGRVVVQDRPVRVDKKGNWSTKVQLRRGRQKLMVKVADPMGREAQRSSEIVVDDKAPNIDKENRLWGAQ